MDPRRSLFKKCMPCLGAPIEQDPEVYIKKTFGDQYSEYEYVIENLAITAVPKALLDEVPSEKPKKTKKKLRIKSPSNNTETAHENGETSKESTSKKELELKKKPPVNAIGDLKSSTAQDRLGKNKLFGGDVPYNPCYLHLCPNKNACRECKLSPENKQDILRRMLVPPGHINVQTNPLIKQVIVFCLL